MNMFLGGQGEKDIFYYSKMLKTIGSLSRLFSESNEPYIQYRIAENLFCKSFGADNLSRTDCSADATKDKLGVGIKTFLEKNGSTMQKVAEFNSDHGFFSDLDLEEKIMKIAHLRNERIEATKRIFGLDGMIYHCVTRKKSGILVYECPMDKVRIDKVGKIGQKKNIISFIDGLNEYSFNITKSTLYRRFTTENIVLDLPVKILDNPFEALEKMFEEAKEAVSFAPIKESEHIFLPLYSYKSGKRTVQEKSGLNLWNASGRQRNPNEIYIQIPSWIHREFAGFFPPREAPFTLVLPDGNEMSAKVCQDGSKALMSNPNSALGQWLLRDVLNLKERELLTYNKLEEIGLDSVVIYKLSDGRYDIDFTRLGAYDEFENKSVGELRREDED